ncbi:hypothetical protein CARUB_v10026661mg [Capsella rubella]|uniref:RBR-type E3 ubiquitin transferase n=1 Tax=Capsella rubella TaxID=81985 RepID=R0EXJ1_9BRAS|nr:uncharacterized protein LOC17875313 [Capsella rubella]EOA13596.1 hypothetical protein CARUB_v10026661mg [Capsella rubella]
MDFAAVKTPEEPQFHKLYFNSLVERERHVKTTRVEVIICDPEDNMVFKTTNPPLQNLLPYMTSMEADIRALMLGLTEATFLGITRISIYCRPRHPIFEYLLEISEPEEKKIALLMDDVKLIRKLFRSSNLVMMLEEDVKFVSRLVAAETCIICFDHFPSHLMFSACEYGHRFCLTCAKSHIEVKLLDREIPDCPQHRCRSQLSLVRFRGILTKMQSFMWTQIIRENSIPIGHRVYCPHQSCSYVMSKTEFSASSECRRRACFKCGGSFCIDCRVPWHNTLSCTEYRILHPQNDDEKLISLAKYKKWRQCGYTWLNVLLDATTWFAGVEMFFATGVEAAGVAATIIVIAVCTTYSTMLY